MKIVTIILIVFGAVALGIWITLEMLTEQKSESAYNMHPSNFEKPLVEHVENFQKKAEEIDLLPNEFSQNRKQINNEDQDETSMT
ncbi:MAG: hypothetical protein ACPGJS_18535 [Flammeovirgaceae bacterium]